MDARGIAARIHDLTAAKRRALIALLLATTAALVLAVIAATGAWLIVAADLALTALSLFTSHSSALFALLPLALVVFGLATPLGLTFLMITTLMWGAFRLPPLFPALQTILLAITATIATAWGVGPFAELGGGDARGAIVALQLFLLTHAAAGLFVAAQSAEWSTTTDALAARERDATLVASELMQLNTQKDDFISAVSHELRTLVTGVRSS
jgi:integral membrane sensor domain MASE1